MRKQLNKASKAATIAGVVVPMGESGFSALPKKTIVPITITLKVTFNKINVHGTLSGGEIISATGVNTLSASAPKQGGGCVWVKVADIRSVKVLGDVGVQSKPVVKKPLW